MTSVLRPSEGDRGQVAMVFDLNKCMGCQTCSVACKVLWTREEGEQHQWWMTVNTQPGSGTPKDWEQMGGGVEHGGKPRSGHQPTRADFGGGWEFNYQEVFYGGKGKSVHLRPEESESSGWGMNWDEDQGGGEWPNSYYFYLPRLCNHCTRPVCAEACPTGAMYKRREDGIVLRNEDVCMGSRFCMEACPYKKIYFNYARNVAQHCILCFPRLERGVAPACARQCPGRLAFVGMLEDADGPIHRLVHEWMVALPLHGEYGTGPNIFYVPPLSPYRLHEDMTIDYETPRIPPEYLESLFGPNVHRALATLKQEMETVREGGTSDLIDTLIAYKWQSLFGPFTVDPGDLDGNAVPVRAHDETCLRRHDMFVYSLSGLALSSDDSSGPLEVEENETTARSSVYQWLGRIFTAPDLEHFELACDGRWAKELTAAAERLPYVFDVPEVQLASGVSQQSYERAFEEALGGKLLGAAFEGDREHALEEIRRAYEYFGLTASENGLAPDHLVSECDYLQYLTFREAAVPSDRLRRSYRRAQIDFLDQHLAWVQNLIVGDESESRLPFTDWQAQILVSFLAADSAYIRELVGG